MIGLSKTELAAAEVIIAWRSTRSSLSQRKSGTWRRGAVTMDAGKEGRASMYARYDQTGTCAPLLILSKRWGTIVMESCVTRECHAQFGERDRETRLLRRRKVRSVPTPLSPAIANMALDGLSQQLLERFPRSKRGNSPKVNLARYADDFIVTGVSKELLEQEGKPFIEAFMKERGLSLSEEKTVITHIEDGFDFLGLRVRKYPNDVVLITPSKKNVKAFLKKVRGIIEQYKDSSAGQLVVKLNPVIRGWATYHGFGSSSQTFNSVDSAIFKKLWWWARRRHPRKSATWVKRKYFTTVGTTNWVFTGEVEDEERHKKLVHLRRAFDVKIQRHTPIQGEANPFDPDWEVYFEKRLGVKMAQNLAGRRQLRHLWEEQNGICPMCQRKITQITGWHNHHIIWKSKGGTHHAANRVLLHPTCHRQLHSQGLYVEKPRPPDQEGR